MQGKVSSLWECSFLDETFNEFYHQWLEVAVFFMGGTEIRLNLHECTQLLMYMIIMYLSMRSLYPYTISFLFNTTVTFKIFIDFNFVYRILFDEICIKLILT